jgi:hypothetical protein
LLKYFCLTLVFDGEETGGGEGGGAEDGPIHERGSARLFVSISQC